MTDRLPSISVDALPGINYWDALRIDDTISREAAGGALLGILIANPLGRVAVIAASLGRHHGGPLAGQLAWYAGWTISAYLALLVIANWPALDDQSDPGTSES